MDTNKLTTKSRDAVSAALRNALTAGNPSAEPSHLLHALLMVPGNTVAPLLTSVGADPTVVDAAAQGAITKLPSASGSSVSQPTLSGSFARVLADAETRAEQLGDADLLLGRGAEDRDDGPGGQRLGQGGLQLVGGDVALAQEFLHERLVGLDDGVHQA